MPAHLRPEQIRAGLQHCLAKVGPWSGALFRFTTVRYSNRTDLLTGIGSRKHGGRWNPPGLFNCVYGSLDPQTALEESMATFRAYGIPQNQARPRVLVAVNLKLQAVLDLTSTQCMRHLGVGRQELTKLDWQANQDCGEEAVTQTIGRLAWEAELEAILIPSARSEGTNIAVFPGRRRKGSSWKIQGARDLPKEP